MLKDDFLKLGEYAASVLYEDPDRSLFYRKALGLRRFYENCELAVFRGELLYPSGVAAQKMSVVLEYLKGLTLKALILGYMKQGGIQLQVPYASKEELLDAYEHPKHHRNLIVRVGGYSEYFNRLSDEMKRMVINRTIQDGRSI